MNRHFYLKIIPLQFNLVAAEGIHKEDVKTGRLGSVNKTLI